MGVLGHTDSRFEAGRSAGGTEVEMAESETPRAPVDRVQAAGSVGLVLVVAVALVALVVFLLFVGRDRAGPFILAILAALAVVGVFALFAAAAGILQLAGRGIRHDLAQAIAEGAPDGIAVVDAAGRVLFANPAYLEITGAASLEEARPVERLFPSDPGVSEPIYRLAQAVREGAPAVEEIRLPVGERGARWLRVRVRPLGGATKHPRSAVWVVSDVTRERAGQENAFLELQHAIDYLDHAPAGFFSADPAGRIVYLNATLAGWLGYDLAEFSPTGMKLAELVQGAGASLLLNIASTPGEVVTQVFDLDLRRKNGQSLPVRLYHKVAFAADGTPGSSRTLVVNRTRSDAPGDAVRAAEVRFARFFHNSPLAIATIDSHGRIGQSNATFARLVGGVETRSIFAAAEERERARFESLVHAALEERAGTKTIEVPLAGPGQRVAQFYVTPLEEANGEAAIVHAVDTTEQRTLQTQFAQAQKMNAVGQLAGGVAHDFNNVLTAIIGYTDLLLANHRPTDPSFQDLMQIKQNANRAAGLVRQLLAFSRRQTLRPQVLELGEVLSDLSIGLLKRIIGETVQLEVKHGRELWTVKADLNQFEQAIVNLAVNARDAMPAGGRLTIRTRNVPAAEVASFGLPEIVATDYVLIEVSDTGTGIEPEIIDKIFEPFFSTKEVGKGTGLGLSTVYGIIKQTGGYIHVDSRLGAGSTFRILLPRHSAPPVEVPAPVAQLPAADLTGTGTVLLVEDEEAVRAFAARALVSRGYTVLEAASGIDALALVEEHGDAIDLVVSDVVMPEMDGPTLLRELRRRRSAVKVIFISGYAEEAFRKNLPEGEKFVFLPKPFTLKELVAAVKETMA